MADTKPGIDKDLIRDLAALLTETELSEIEIEQKGFRVRVSRVLSGQQATHAVHAGAPSAERPSKGSPPPGGNEAADPGQHPGVVPSPMVGTVYRASEPGGRPFVEVGDTVSAGQTILIVEAMKHMNEVASPRAGKIAAVMVEDGQPVEYGEPLMIIE